MAAAKDEKPVASADGAPGEGEAGGEAPKKTRLPGKKLVLFVAAPLLLLGGGGGGAAYFMGYIGGARDMHAEEPKKPPKPAVFYNLPELLVNLNASQGRRSNFLKISLSLELDDANDIPRVESVLPRIVDAFQTYLRELRPEDLRGSAGLFRLREELMVRVNASAQPAKINDVLFKEMLVQ